MTDVGSTMTLVRSVYAPEFRLILLATDATAAAEAAISEALRLDAREAPRREAERRTQDALDASTTRLNNKAAFRP